MIAVARRQRGLDEADVVIGDVIADDEERAAPAAQMFTSADARMREQMGGGPGEQGIDGGANPTLRNKVGKTPLDRATTTNPDKRVQKDFASTRELLKIGKTRQS